MTRWLAPLTHPDAPPPTVDATALRAAIGPWLKPALRVALVRTDFPDPTGNRQGGEPWMRPHEPWPRCGVCAGALAFVAQFRQGNRLWRFFYCQECKPWSDEERRAGCCRLDGVPWEDTQCSVPARAEAPSGGLEPAPWRPAVYPAAHAWALTEVLSPPLLGDQAALETPWPAAYGQWLDRLAQVEGPDHDASTAVFASWGAWAGAGTQVGGHAHPLQDPIVIRCPDCSAVLPLLARLDTEPTAGWWWADMGAVYLHACPDHPHVVHVELQSP